MIRIMIRTLTIITLILVAIIFETTMRHFEIPVALGDLFFLPASLLLTAFLLSPRYHSACAPQSSQQSSLRSKIEVYIILLVIIIPIAVFCLWVGFSDPLQYLSGTGKPPVHGYTLFALGVLIVCAIASTTYATIRFKYQQRDNNRASNTP